MLKLILIHSSGGMSYHGFLGVLCSYFGQLYSCIIFITMEYDVIMLLYLCWLWLSHTVHPNLSSTHNTNGQIALFFL